MNSESNILHKKNYLFELGAIVGLILIVGATLLYADQVLNKKPSQTASSFPMQATPSSLTVPPQQVTQEVQKNQQQVQQELNKIEQKIKQIELN